MAVRSTAPPDAPKPGVGEGAASCAPAITVLMSCYEAERWLAQAIDSVLAQTFEDFELILIDDGSTDQTGAIIDAYQRADSRIVKLAKPNTGLADSLNRGIACARAAWIARLDADDVAESHRFAAQMRLAACLPRAVLIGSGFVEIDESGARVKAHTYPTRHNALVDNLVRLRRFFPHSSALYRTDAVRRVGGYNRRFRVADDKMLWLELSRVGRLACVEAPLVRVRKHASQVSVADQSTLQVYEDVAATVAHLVAVAGGPHLARTCDDREWATFYAWIRDRLNDSGWIASRTTWMTARARYMASSSRALGMAKFAGDLVRSGHAVRLMRHKLAGSTIAQRLALGWMNDRAARPTLRRAA